MQCTNCGTEIADTAKFCLKCGTKVKNEEKQQDAQSFQKTSGEISSQPPNATKRAEEPIQSSAAPMGFKATGGMGDVSANSLRVTGQTLVLAGWIFALIGFALIGFALFFFVPFTGRLFGPIAIIIGVSIGFKGANMKAQGKAAVRADQTYQLLQAMQERQMRIEEQQVRGQMAQASSVMSSAAGGLQVAASGFVSCPKCGSQISASTKFCPECGTPMKLKCTKCGREMTIGMKFCPECGTKQIDSQNNVIGATALPPNIGAA